MMWLLEQLAMVAVSAAVAVAVFTGAWEAMALIVLLGFVEGVI